MPLHVRSYLILLAFTAMACAWGVVVIGGPAPTTLEPNYVSPQGTPRRHMPRLLRAVLERHDEAMLIRARPKWPRDLPVSFRIRTFRADGEFFWIDFADCDENVFAGYMMTQMRMSMRDRPRTRWDGTHSVPAHCVDANGTVTLKTRITTAHAKVPWSSEFRTLTFDVELVDSVDDIMSPIDDRALLDRLAAETSFFLGRQYQALNESVTKVHVGTAFPAEMPEETTVAMRVKFFAGEDVLFEVRYCLNEGYRRRPSRPGFLVGTDVSVDTLLGEAAGRPIRARVFADPEYALRDFQNDQYLHWDGYFEVDVDASALVPEQ